MAHPHHITRGSEATVHRGETTISAAAVTSEQQRLLDHLVDCQRSMQLTELHTHLLGMGSWRFWMDEIMVKHIPAWVVQVEENIQNLEFYPAPSSLSHASVFDHRPAYAYAKVTGEVLRSYLKDRCSRALTEELERNQALRWTADVVYDVETWKKALHVDSVQMIASQFAFGNREASERLVHDLRQKWIVFNAREQVFELREGITNQQLLGYRESFRGAVEPVLKNCFTMLNPDGSTQADHMVTKYYQDQFTPEFYPRRFALKDDMYSQYLCVLDELLTHVLARYRASGCGYVEFSVGYNDLIKRPWVFRHLYEATHANEHQAHRVIARFLVGFGRHESVPYPGTVEALEKQNDPESQQLVSDLKARQCSEVDLCFEEALYRGHLDKLDLMCSLFFPEECTGEKGKTARKLAEVVVGLDYLADERNHPFCPFGLHRFMEFVKNCRRVHNGRFGVRYHCGEFALDPSKEEHFVHMQISARIIHRILTKIDERGPPPLRIGHGIAFLRFQDCLHKAAMSLSLPEKDIRLALEEMDRRGTPIEVNLRSNELLVAGLRENHDAVRVFSQTMHLPVVLSTDNDGIWNVHTKLGGIDFFSVAGEFALAIEQNVIPDLERARNFVKDSRQARFDYAPNSRELMYTQTSDGSRQAQVSAVPSAARTSSRPSQLQSSTPGLYTQRVAVSQSVHAIVSRRELLCLLLTPTLSPSLGGSFVLLLLVYV
jgi:hypothetical protein